jgi:hypothetical protein
VYLRLGQTQGASHRAATPAREEDVFLTPAGVNVGEAAAHRPSAGDRTRRVARYRTRAPPATMPGPRARGRMRRPEPERRCLKSHQQRATRRTSELAREGVFSSACHCGRVPKRQPDTLTSRRAAHPLPSKVRGHRSLPIVLTGEREARARTPLLTANGRDRHADLAVGCLPGTRRSTHVPRPPLAADLGNGGCRGSTPRAELAVIRRDRRSLTRGLVDEPLQALLAAVGQPRSHRLDRLTRPVENISPRR